MAKQTNEQKYKTAEERVNAFSAWCSRKSCDNCEFDNVTHDCTGAGCQFHWLTLEAEEEKLEPCPECNSKCELMESSIGDFFVGCSQCYYRIGGKKMEAAAIAAHNRVARAVRAAKESEVSNGN